VGKDFLSGDIASVCTLRRTGSIGESSVRQNGGLGIVSITEWQRRRSNALGSKLELAPRFNHVVSIHFPLRPTRPMSEYDDR
jgi:hypothetical protein